MMNRTARRAATLLSARALLPVGVLREDVRKFLEVLNKEPDFSVIVVSLGYVDACLAALLHSFLLKSSASDELLASGRGALGTFYARSSIAYVLGLISKSIYQDLIVLGKIRNLVAHHHLTLKFEDPAISEECLRLKYIETLKNGDLDEPLFAPEQMPEPDMRFKITLVIISEQILKASESVERIKAQGDPLTVVLKTSSKRRSS